MNRQRNLWAKEALRSAYGRGASRFATLRDGLRLRGAGSRLRAASSQLGRTVTLLGQPIVDLLLPPRCACCGAEQELFAHQVLLCDVCRKSFTDGVAARCKRCGAVAAGDCLACRKRQPRFEQLVTLGPYAGPLRATVLRLKRPGHDALAEAMGLWLTERLLASLDAEDEPLVLANAVVMPVPMHWMRRVFQQVNSPDLVAAALAARMSLPLADDWLARRRHTPRQGPMLRTERLRNVRGAFELHSEEVVRDAHVIVVDDVVTTGATCDEVARVLRRAGARRVTVATLARADSPR
ncbi:MAG TPA: phosphoribosyltransferase family protein [Pirellulales bacterium]